MSIKVMTEVWDHAPVTGTELLLMLAIADQANDLGKDAWPSIDTLARRTRLNARTVQRLIRRLSERGLIQVEPGGGRRSNRYTINRSQLIHDRTAPVDNHADPPAPRHRRQHATGGTGATGGVAELHHRSHGTAAPPVPSYPVLSPTSATPDPPPSNKEEAAKNIADADEVLRRIHNDWRLTAVDRHRIRPRLISALSAGYKIDQLITYLSSNPGGVRSPFAVITARLNELPHHPEPSGFSTAWPAWCGRCDGPEPHRRLIQLDGNQVKQCPHCHPKWTINNTD